MAVFGVVVLLFSGCDWSMYGYDAAHTGSSSDTAINGANASTLKALFTVPAQSDPNGNTSQFGPPVVSNGVVYVGSSDPEGTGGTLEAFDADGSTECSGSPNQCSPLWTATTGLIDPLTAPAVANGVVYIASSTEAVSSPVPPTLYAFDANGVTNCSGTPKVCQPLWTAPLNIGGACCSIAQSPNVTNGTVYVSTNQMPGPPPNGPTGNVQAFDANGATNCSGTPKVCQPLWTTASDVGYSAPAVANGVLYAVGEDTLDAFSANGTTDCSGTPTACQPLWTATLDATPTYISTVSPEVSNGVVYAASANGNLDAFDANGVTNCSGAPASCTPLWTATGAGLDAVANGIVYGETVSNNDLAAFDAKGITNCSGTPKVCTPMWSDSIAGPVGPVSVANGLVFSGSTSCAAACDTDPGFNFEAFDAGGVTKCSGTPKVCQPVWSSPTADPLDSGSPAIANGKIYVGEQTWASVDTSHPSRLDAWVLPPPTTAVIKPSTNSTVSGTQGLDATASSGVTQVQYELTGGTLNDKVIANGMATIYGWTASWNTTTVPNGVYTLQSVASYGGEVSGTSSPITITVSN